jgi:methionyl-tRNA formyltransferase
VRLVVAGTPSVALPSLAALAASRHEVLAVVTRPDAPAGRGRRLVRSPVAEWADAHDVPVLTPRRPAEPEFLAALRHLAPDCCPVVAYGALVPRAALDVPVHGWVNLHFSLLPAWRGAAPVQRALMAGDAVTGASTFRLEEGLDTGPVYGVLTEPVRPRDTAGDLLGRLAEAGAGLLVATLDGIADGALVPRPQTEDGVSLAPKVSVEEARVDWALPAYAVDRRVRGCTPEPGAWTTLRGERVKLAPLEPLAADDAAPAAGAADDRPAKPGEILAGRRDVLVGTGSGVVRLGDVRAQGRRPMPAADWARGLRLEPGESFS